MDRDRVIDIRPDARYSQIRDDRVTRLAHIHGVLVEDVGSAVRGDRQPDRQLPECLVIAGSDRLPPRGIARELRELGKANRRRQIRHPEVVAEHLELVARAHPLVSIDTQPVGQHVVVRGDEPALRGGHVLGGVQAERPVAETPRHPAPEGRAVRLAGILDHRQAVPVADRPDHVHVGDQAKQVDRADGTGPRRDRLLDSLGVDQVGVGLDIDEHRRRAG